MKAIRTIFFPANKNRVNDFNYYFILWTIKHFMQKIQLFYRQMDQQTNLIIKWTTNKRNVNKNEWIKRKKEWWIVRILRK